MPSYLPANIQILSISLLAVVLACVLIYISERWLNYRSSIRIQKEDIYKVVLSVGIGGFGIVLLTMIPIYKPIDELTFKDNNHNLDEVFYNSIFIYNDEMYSNPAGKDMVGYRNYKVNLVRSEEKPENLEVINLNPVFEIVEEEFITTEKGKTENGNTSYFHTFPILTENKHAYNIPKGEVIYQLEKIPTTNKFCFFYDNMYYRSVNPKNDEIVFNNFTFTDDTYITKDDFNGFIFYKNEMPDAYRAYFIAESSNVYVEIIFGIVGIVFVIFGIKNTSKIRANNGITNKDIGTKYYKTLKTLMLGLALFSMSTVYVMVGDNKFIRDSLTIYSQKSNNDNPKYKSESYKSMQIDASRTDSGIYGFDDNANFRENYYKRMIYHDNNIYAENPVTYFLLSSQEEIELEEELTSENFDRNKTYQFKDERLINGNNVTEISGDKILVFEKALKPTEELFIEVGEPVEIKANYHRERIGYRRYRRVFTPTTIYPHTLPVLEEEGQSFNMSTETYLYSTDFDVNRDDEYFFVLYNDCLYEMTNDLFWQFEEILNLTDAYFVETTEEKVVTKAGYYLKGEFIEHPYPSKMIGTDNPITYEEVVYTHTVKPFTVQEPSYLDEYYNGDDYNFEFKHLAYIVWGSFVVVSILFVIEVRKKRNFETEKKNEVEKTL